MRISNQCFRCKDIFCVMDHLFSLFNLYFHEPIASLANGMILGKKLQTTQIFYDQIKAVGLLHIVVLSGMNVSLLTAILMNLLAGIIHRTYASIITIVCILGYVLFVGAEPPLIRATIMAILALVATIYGRTTLAIYSLFLSGIIMLIIRFEWITSISFQLSFGATLGIVLFGNIQKHSFRSSKSGKISKLTNVLEYIQQELRITLSAQFFTLPLIYLYFKEISLVAPLANILVAWTIAPITVFGMIILVVGLAFGKVGFVLSWLIYPLLWWIVFVIRLLSQIPFGFIRLY